MYRAERAKSLIIPPRNLRLDLHAFLRRHVASAT